MNYGPRSPLEAFYYPLAFTMAPMPAFGWHVDPRPLPKASQKRRRKMLRRLPHAARKRAIQAKKRGAQ